MSSSMNTHSVSSSLSSVVTDDSPQLRSPSSSDASALTPENVSTPASGSVSSGPTSIVIDPTSIGTVVAETPQVSASATTPLPAALISDALSKVVQFGPINWSTEDKIGKRLLDLSVPYHIFRNSSYSMGAAILSVHHWFTASKISLTLSAPNSPFAAGCLALVYHPYGLSEDDIVIDNLVDTNCALLNIGSGNSITLEVDLLASMRSIQLPTSPPVYDFPSFMKMEPAALNNYGTVGVYVFNPLVGTQVSLWPSSFTLSASFIDPSVSLPRRYIPPLPASLEGVVASTLAAAAIGGVAASASSAILKVGEHCTVFQNGASDGITTLDLVLTNDTRHVIPYAFTPKDLDDVEPSVEIPAATTISGICAHRSRVGILQWNSEFESFNLISTLYLRPTIGYNADDLGISDGTATIVFSNMGMASLPFEFWRGDITLTVEPVANAYYRGSLVMVYVPPGLSDGNIASLQDALGYPHVILNLGEQSKTTVTFPFNARTEYLQTERPFVYGESVGNTRRSNCPDIGSVKFYVNIPLYSSTSETSPSFLHVNVYAHSSNMRFAVPFKDSDRLSMTVRKFHLPPQQMDSGLTMFPPGMSSSPTVITQSHDDLVALLSRRHPLCIQSVGAGFRKLIVRAPTFPLFNGMSNYPFPLSPINPFSLFSTAFAAYSGSMVYGLMVSGGSDVSVEVAHSVSFKNTDFLPYLNWVDVDSSELRLQLLLKPSVMSSMSLNKVREFSVPFYSPYPVLPTRTYVRTGDNYHSRVAFAEVTFYIKTSAPVTVTVTQSIGPGFKLHNFVGARSLTMFGDEYTDPSPPEDDPPEETSRLNRPAVPQPLEAAPAPPRPDPLNGVRCARIRLPARLADDSWLNRPVSRGNAHQEMFASWDRTQDAIESTAERFDSVLSDVRTQTIPAFSDFTGSFHDTSKEVSAAMKSLKDVVNDELSESLRSFTNVNNTLNSTLGHFRDILETKLKPKSLNMRTTDGYFSLAMLRNFGLKGFFAILFADVLDILLSVFPFYGDLVLSAFNLFGELDPCISDVLTSAVSASVTNQIYSYCRSDGKKKDLPRAESGFTEIPIISSIFMLLSFGISLASGFSSPDRMFADFTKNFSFLNLTRGSMSLAFLTESLEKLWNVFSIKVLGAAPRGPAQWLIQNRVEVSDFGAFVDELRRKTTNEILSDLDLRGRVLSQKDFSEILHKNVKDLVKEPKYSVLLKDVEYFRTLVQQCRLQPPDGVRPRPTVVTFLGEPQVGKTFLASTSFSHYVQELMNWKHEPVFMVNSASDNYMSGYAQQRITIMDDFLQSRTGDDLKGFMNLIGNAPCRLNMAALDEKGMQFLSEVVVITMNEFHPKVDKFISTPSALYERIYEHCFYVTTKNGRKLDKATMAERGMVAPDDYLNFYRQTYVNKTRSPPEGTPGTQGERVLFTDIVKETVAAVKMERISAENARIMSGLSDVRPRYVPFADLLKPQQEAKFECGRGTMEETMGHVNYYWSQLKTIDDEFKPEEATVDQVALRCEIPVSHLKTSLFRKIQEACQFLTSCGERVARPFVFSKGVLTKIFGNVKIPIYLPTYRGSYHQKGMTYMKIRTNYGPVHLASFYFPDDYNHFSVFDYIPSPNDIIEGVLDSAIDAASVAGTIVATMRLSVSKSCARYSEMFSDLIETCSKVVRLENFISYMKEIIPEKIGYIMAFVLAAGGVGGAVSWLGPSWIKSLIFGESPEDSSSSSGAEEESESDEEELTVKEKKKVDKNKKKANDLLEKHLSVSTPRSVLQSFYSKGDPFGNPKPSRIRKNKMAVPKARVIPSVIPQQESDFPIGVPLFAKNVVFLRYGDYRACATAWKRSTLIVNRHVLENIPDGASVEITRRRPSKSSEGDYVYSVVLRHADLVCADYEDGIADFAIWRTGWRGHTFPDLSKHFITHAELGKIRGQEGYRLSGMVTTLTSLDFISKQKVSSAQGDILEIPLSITAKAPAARGSCGSPWIVTNDALFGNIGKIVGIHGWGDGVLSGSIPVTIEFLESLEEAFSEPDLCPSQITYPLQEASAIFKDAQKFNEVLGDVSPQLAIYQPTDTELVKTPIFNEVFENGHGPSVLSDRDSRLSNPEVFLSSIAAKTDNDIGWFENPDEVSRAVTHIKESLRNLESTPGRRVLTIDEAINGVDGSRHSQESGLEMRNSPGYPWNRKAGKGKYPYFKELPQVPGERVKYEIDDDALVERVNERIRCALKGEVCPNSIWMDVIKDELRPLAKVSSGNSRIVNAPPLDLMIVWNMYFGAFRIMFMDPRYVGLRLESALGADPKKIWPELGRLMNKASFSFGVDYTKFDSTQSACFYENIVDIINDWYGGTPEENLVRKVLYFEVGHTLHMFRSTVYLDSHGLPSGVCGGFTTISNIMVNKIVSRIAFQRTGLPLGCYSKYIRAIFMGDDNLQIVLPANNPEIDEKLDNYNRITLAQTVAEIGMKVTMPDKSELLTHHDEFEDITFLKCWFQDHLGNGLFLPAIDPTTIKNLVNWHRPRKNPEQFVENIDNALGFACAHGKGFYDEFVSKLKQNQKFSLLYEKETPSYMDAFEQSFPIFGSNSEIWDDL